MMEMVEELVRSQLGVKLKDLWCGVLLYVDDIVPVADTGMELQIMLEVVQACVIRWRMKLHRRKSKIMIVGKKEGGTSWKIDEIMEEVEEFKYLGVWFDRKLRGNVHFDNMANKAKEWIVKVMLRSIVNSQVEADKRKNAMRAYRDTKCEACSRSVVVRRA